jgi:hypothetical protein
MAGFDDYFNHEHIGVVFTEREPEAWLKSIQARASSPSEPDWVKPLWLKWARLTTNNVTALFREYKESIFSLLPWTATKAVTVTMAVNIFNGGRYD